MPDFRLAAQVALYTALSQSADVLATLRAVGLEGDAEGVFQAVPEDADPPIVVIDEMSATPAGGKGDRFDLIEVSILTIVRRPGREFVTPTMAAVRDTIEGAALANVEGVELSKPVWLSDDDEELPDGQTYLGTQRFSLFAQPAN